MKVVQVMPEFALAGAEIMAENLTYGLLGLGVEVVIISLYNFHSVITERLEAKGVKIYYLSKKHGLDISQIYKIYKVLKQEKPDIIHTHRYVMEYAIPAAVMAKVKGRVHTVHNIATKENGNIQRKFNKLFFKFFNAVPVSISPEVKKTVLEEYGLKANSVPEIYNGECLARFIPKTDYSYGDKIKLLHIGRFQEQKNHEGLIKAFAELTDKYPNLELELVGDGKLKSSMEKLVEKLHITKNVEFLGLRNDVAILLHNADIFVLPSQYEGMPMTLIEAMATGLPIVATKVGGVSDMIENNRTGLLVDVDVAQIVKAIKILIEDEKLRRYLGENAEKKADQFSCENMAKEYIKTYKKYEQLCY